MSRYGKIAFYRIHCRKENVNNYPEQDVQRYPACFNPHKCGPHVHTTKLQYIRQIEYYQCLLSTKCSVTLTNSIAFLFYDPACLTNGIRTAKNTVCHCNHSKYRQYYNQC